MKKIFYLFTIALLLLTIACKKEKKVSVTGYWIGYAQPSGSSSTVPLSIVYRSDNTARAYLTNTDTTLAVTVEGTYSIATDSTRTWLTAGGNTTEFAGKLNSANIQMNGSYRSLTNSSSGIWSLTKQ